METRTRLRVGLAASAALLACAFGCLLACSERDATGDVVLIVLDTVRRDALGCYGNPRRPTPNIDAIAADGVRFDQAISPSGWTLPAVASLLTSTWPTIHGARGKGIVLTPVRSEIPMAAEILGGEAFATISLTNAAFVSPMLGFDRGFDVVDHYYGYNREVRRADASIDAALAHLEELGGRARFLLVHLFDAHLDYDPPGDYATRYTGGRGVPAPPIGLPACEALYRNGGKAPPSAEDIDYITAVYHGEVAFMDTQLGRLVAYMKEKGIYDGSTIVVTADHGEEFWEHGGFEHGHTLYDELVRVPLIVKLPASAEIARPVIATQVSIVDVMPTLFELSGIEAPETFTGRSLLPLIRGETDDDHLALSESTLYGPSRIALRGSRYKYVYDLSRETGELYDWRADPGEERDLADSQPAAADRMRAQLLAIHAALDEEAGRLSVPAPVNLSPKRVEQLRGLGYIR